LGHVERLSIKSMIWTSSLQIQRPGYSGHFNFIILFVGNYCCMLLTCMVWLYSHIHHLNF